MTSAAPCPGNEELLDFEEWLRDPVAPDLTEIQLANLSVDEVWAMKKACIHWKL